MLQYLAINKVGIAKPIISMRGVSKLVRRFGLDDNNIAVTIPKSSKTPMFAFVRQIIAAIIDIKATKIWLCRVACPKIGRRFDARKMMVATANVDKSCGCPGSKQNRSSRQNTPTKLAADNPSDRVNLNVVAKQRTQIAIQIISVLVRTTSWVIGRLKT